MGSLWSSVLEGVEGVWGLWVYTALVGGRISLLLLLLLVLGCEGYLRMKRLHVLGEEVSLEMRGVGMCGLGRREEEEAMCLWVQIVVIEEEEEFEKEG